jgi:hypothetical protein
MQMAQVLKICKFPSRAPSSEKTRAAPRSRWLRLHRLRHQHSSLTTTSTHLRPSPRALCACSFMCGYLDTGTQPRQRPQHTLARLPRPRLQHPCYRLPQHRHKGLSPRMSMLASSIAQASATRYRPRCSRYGECQPVGSYLRLPFSLIVRGIAIIYVSTATTTGEC